MLYVCISIAVALVVAACMPFLISILKMDIPNDRSAHTVPVPRGAGWLALGVPIVVFLFAPALIGFPIDMAYSMYALSGSLLMVMAISAADDCYTLGARIRLLVHVMAAALTVFMLPETVRVLPLLPEVIENMLLILGLVWMMNLTNFMDGINGITAVNGIITTVGLGIFAVLYDPALMISASLLWGGLIGFMVWNWGNAKVFMGDVGSIPMGLWLGYGLIMVADQVGIIPALLLALYPILDATITLIRRAWQRKPIWQAHKEHFYQQAVQNGRTHAHTSTLIATYNLLCLSLFLIALYVPQAEWGLLMVAVLGFSALTTLFTRKPRHAT